MYPDFAVMNSSHTNTCRPVSPTLRYSAIQLKKNESILDLTDSEDEEDSVVDDTSLRHLIRVTSHTLSEEGKILEEESFIELQPPDRDQEDDGLNRELSQLKYKEDSLQKEINFAVDKVAYGHKSTSEWSDRLVSNKSTVVTDNEIMNANNKKEEQSSEDFTEKILDKCICCT